MKVSGRSSEDHGGVTQTTWASDSLPDTTGRLFWLHPKGRGRAAQLIQLSMGLGIVCVCVSRDGSPADTEVQLYVEV